jgi:hypothetical protein
MVRSSLTRASSSRGTEPRPQAEADRLSQRTSWRGDFLRPAASFDKHIAEPANGRDRPRVSLRAERRFHLADERLGRQRLSPAAEPAKNIADQLRADSTVASEVITAGERAGTGCACAVSSCCACGSSPRSSNCSRQRCGVSRDSHQSSSVPTSVKLALRRTSGRARAFFCRSATRSPAEHDDGHSLRPLRPTQATSPCASCRVREL